MLDVMLYIALAILAVSVLLCLLRILKGPSISDRVIALDSLGIHLIAMTAMMAALLRTSAFMGIILLIGILSFIGTLSFSKFIERGVVFERNRGNH